MEQQSQSQRRGMSLFAMLASMERSGVFKVSRARHPRAPTSAASARSPSTKPTESASTHAHTPTAAATCRISELPSTAHDDVPKCRAEVEANFDLRAFLGAPELMPDALSLGPAGDFHEPAI